MTVLKGLFLVVWSLIGVVVLTALVGLLLFISAGGPQKLLQSLNPAALLGGLVGTSGQSSENQSPGTPPELDLDCAKKIVGATRAQELLKGVSQPTASEQKSIQKCFSSAPSGGTGASQSSPLQVR